MKVLKDAALVVSAVALVATGIGVAAGGSLAFSFGAAADTLGGAIGLSAGVSEAIITGATLTTGLGLIEGILPKPSQGGQQTKWKADPYAGLPYLMGRTLTAGNIVARRGSGGNNPYEHFVTVLSVCTIKAIEASFANRTTLEFDGGGNVTTGFYQDRIYQRSQLGLCPEPSALTPVVGAFPGWGASNKLSGLAAVLNTMKYDAKGKHTMTTEPQMAHIVQGVYAYDPREDDTYPGGAGACRAFEESTYPWSETPQIHGLTFAMGRYENGQRVFGIGIGSTIAGQVVKSIDVASFVEGANLSEARGWKIGGQIVSRPDTPWNNLKKILQAGGSYPVIVGGRISCINRAPRVSLATIGRGDIAGDCSFSGTQPRKTRINGVIPQYRSEAHDWEIVPAEAVIVADYVTFDGGERTKEITYELVQQVDQASQLAAYDICEAREAGPGSVPLKPWWLNYRVGDCVTFAPEDGWSVKAIITGRSLDAQTGIVTYTLKSETDSKHDFALGVTGTAPPTASISYDPSVAAPGGDAWAASGSTLSSASGSVPAIEVDGALDNPSAAAILFELRLHVDGQADDEGWEAVSSDAPSTTRKVIASVSPATAYDVAVSYVVRGVTGDRLILGPVTAGQLSTARAAYRIVSQPLDSPISSTDSSIAIAAFDAVLDDGSSYSFDDGSITDLDASTWYGVFAVKADGAYFASASPASAAMANRENIFLGWQSTSDGAGTYPDGGTSTGGSGGGGGAPSPRLPSTS